MMNPVKVTMYLHSKGKETSLAPTSSQSFTMEDSPRQNPCPKEKELPSADRYHQSRTKSFPSGMLDLCAFSFAG
jgi:hypothetical protein